MSGRARTIKVRVALEEAVNGVFAVAFDVARDEKSEGRIAGARKMIKAAAVAPHIATRANLNNKIPLVSIIGLP